MRTTTVISSKFSSPQHWTNRGPDREAIEFSSVGNNFYLCSLGVSPSWYSVYGETRSKVLLLADLADNHVILRLPIPVTLQFDLSQVIAYAYDIDELAFGDDESSALDGMRKAIAESYRILKAEKNNLGPLQAQHWEYLQRIIIEA